MPEVLHEKAVKIGDAILKNPSITVRELRDKFGMDTEEFWHHLYSIRPHPDYETEINKWLLSGNKQRAKRFG